MRASHDSRRCGWAARLLTSTRDSVMREPSGRTQRLTVASRQGGEYENRYQVGEYENRHYPVRSAMSEESPQERKWQLSVGRFRQARHAYGCARFDSSTVSMAAAPAVRVPRAASASQWPILTDMLFPAVTSEQARGGWS